MAFPQKFKAARTAMGFSQVECARRIGVDPVVVSRYERGKVKPNLDRLTAISRELKVSIDSLVADDPDDATSAPAA